MTLPSGIFDNTIPSGLYFFNVYDDPYLSFIISGIGYAEIYEDGGLFFYRNTRGLLYYDGDLTKVGGFTSSMCSTTDGYLVTFTDTTYPLVSTTVKSRALPITPSPSGWTTQATVVGLTAIDALADEGGSSFLDFPVLAATGRLGTTLKIVADDTNIPPFSTFIKSDVGLPSGTLMYKLTDLEATI